MAAARPEGALSLLDRYLKTRREREPHSEDLEMLEIAIDLARHRAR